jgi:hypothetical protein
VAGTQTEWTGALHQTFRLLPTDDISANLRPFLSSDGYTPDEVLERLPYDTVRARARGATGTKPNPKRYRDGKQVYETIGLLYQGDDDRVHVTELGRATLRWLDLINEKNSVILARHAAYALAACQLRNPTGAGNRFHESVEVFPFQFIWRAMLALADRISSDELNRGMFKVTNEDDLVATIQKIKAARAANDVTLLGEEVVTGKGKNDRIIPWMALASFGWAIFPDKRGGEDSAFYTLVQRTRHVVEEASRFRRKHRDFDATEEYVTHLSRCAALPRDVR